MNRRMWTDAGMFGLLVALGVASRLIKEYSSLVPPNFEAVAAASLFAGFYFRSRTIAICVPLATMLISDQVIGGYRFEVMATVYASLVLPVACRPLLQKRLSVLRVGSAALASSTVFYLATNLAHWHCWYPHTLAALGRCYFVALPFFGFTLASSLLFSAALFGAYACYARRAEPAIAQPTLLATH